jgi:hypothetical protein
MAAGSILASQTVYGASQTKQRRRRTNAEIATIKAEIYDLVKRMQPMSVRQVFYQLAVAHILAKTENQYSAVCRYLGEMRRAGEIPYSWIADNTRWMRKGRSYADLNQLLDESAQLYRRDIWRNQDAYVEVWIEKEALAGVVYEITDRWDVPLMVTRGYSSLSFLYEAAENIKSIDRPAFLYYFGDHDPSGVDIPIKVEATLAEMGAHCAFEVVAVTTEQIEQYGLPTRPTKKSDSRSKNFVGDSVELDAFRPDDLRRMVSDCITRHLDPDVLARAESVEAAERQTLEAIALSYRESQE